MAKRVGEEAQSPCSSESRMTKFVHGTNRRSAGETEAGRQDAQLYAEEPRQDEAEPEDRHRHAGERAQTREAVEQRVAPDGGGDADRDAERDRHHDRRHRQLDRRGKAPQQVARDRIAANDRHAEVPLECLADIEDVLLPDRTIEPQARAHLRDLLGVARSPSMVSAGSPGIRWMKLKTRTETPSRTGTMVRLRRMAYRLTAPTPRYCSSTVLKYSEPVGCGT